MRPEIAPRERGPQNVAEFARALADLVPFALRDRRHHGQPLCRLGDADRGGRRGLRCRPRRLGDLGQARLERAQRRR